jgi:phosphonoacetate hydrolase
MMDKYLAKMDAMGAVIALTADHGMNCEAEGRRNAQRHLPPGRDRRAGSARQRRASSCRSPIPTSCHHGRLGSFATIYVEGSGP